MLDHENDFTSPVIVSPETVANLQKFIKTALETLAPPSCDFAAMDAEGDVWAWPYMPELLNADDYYAEWPTAGAFPIAKVNSLNSNECADVYRVAYAYREGCDPASAMRRSAPIIDEAFWKRIFGSVPAMHTYKWGAIDADGAVWLFIDYPVTHSFQRSDGERETIWVSPSPSHAPPMKVDHIPAIGNERAETSVVCRHYFENE